jgi:hypothetical protein
VQLGCLEPSYAAKLATEPFHDMGITIEEEARVVERLLLVSACHPNILQYTCNLLLRRINEKNIRNISPADVEEVIRSHEFYLYYTGVLWGQADAYEKLIVYLMMDSGKQIFDMNDIGAEFDSRRLPKTRLRNAVEVLQLYSLLSRNDGGFSFTFTYLAEASAQVESVTEVIEELMGRVRSGSGLQ